jgi:hypothetical protein
MDKVEIFYGRFEYITAIWKILWAFGNLLAIWYIFPRFGIVCQEKSGNPDFNVNQGPKLTSLFSDTFANFLQKWRFS